jgi:hypothetical protein
MSEFDNLTYLVVDLESIPSGWTNQEKSNSRKRVNLGIGRHNQQQSHLNTCNCTDLPTLFEDDENPDVITQTAGRMMYRLDATQYANEQELIDVVAAEIADELGKTVQAVKAQAEIYIVGGQQESIAEKDNNPEKWNERTE